MFDELFNIERKTITIKDMYKEKLITSDLVTFELNQPDCWSTHRHRRDRHNLEIKGC